MVDVDRNAPASFTLSICVVPLSPTEPTRPSARLAFALDFANLIGVDFNRQSVTLINPDVSAHVLREPSGEWTGLVGETRSDYVTGRGNSIATFSDSDGVYATASTSQLIQPIESGRRC